jgi:uncharacterized protein
MDITPLIPNESKVIQSYGEQGFVISGASYKGSVFVTPLDVIEIPLYKLEDIKENNVVFLSHFPEAEIVLIGTGKTITFIPSNIRQIFKKNNGFAESMDTGAACRTYNTLLADGRNVAAILFPYK